MIRTFFAGLFLMILTASCATAPADLAADDIRPFDIVRYFDGRIDGHGVVERNNRITDRFDMIVEARFEDGFLYLDETFYFEGRAPFNRVWRMEETAPGRWAATADNVQGVTEILVQDGVVYMNYAADFPYRDDMIRLHFDQQLFSMESGLVFNRSQLRKFGIPVGTVTVIFRKSSL